MIEKQLFILFSIQYVIEILFNMHHVKLNFYFFINKFLKYDKYFYNIEKCCNFLTII